MLLRNRWLAPALILLVLIFGLAVYGRLPSAVPSHWNASGRSDATMPRAAAVLLLPAIALGVWALLSALPRIDPRRRGYRDFLPTYRLFVNLIVGGLVLIQVVVLGHALGWQVEPPRLIPAVLGLVFVGLGNELGRVRPNWFVGVRTPWTLSNDEVWRRTHRVGGRAFVVVGLIWIVAALLLPPAVAFIVIMAALLGVSLGLVFYSYQLYQRLQG